MSTQAPLDHRHPIRTASPRVSATEPSKVAFARDHAATEELLRASGVDFVSLRNGFYTESSLYQLGGIQATGKLALPGDGNVSWTLRDDLAQAAVIASTDPSLFQGITAPLTASQTYTFAQIARLASEILSREIAFETIPAESYRQATLQRGYADTRIRWSACCSPCLKRSRTVNLISLTQHSNRC